jgi:hypothetical protein
MRRIDKTLYLKVPPNVIYKNIKKIDKEVFTDIHDFVNLRFQPAPYTQDIPNKKLVRMGRDWIVSFDFIPSGGGSKVIIKGEQTYGIRLGSEIFILVWLYALKGIEAGYNTKS